MYFHGLQINVSSVDEGYSWLRSGDVWAFIQVPKKFTQALIYRHSSFLFSSNESYHENQTFITALIDNTSE